MAKQFRVSFTDANDLLRHISNVNNYIPVSRKQVHGWLLLPPEGTKCHTRFNKHDYVMTTKQSPFLFMDSLGSVDAYSGADLVKLGCVFDANGVHISQDVAKKISCSKENVKWHRVTLTASNACGACFVPKCYANVPFNNDYINVNGVAHGLGDFLVIQPGTHAPKIMNGLVFREWFNNTGITDYLDMKTAITEVPPPDGSALMIAEGRILSEVSAPIVSTIKTAIQQCNGSCHPEIQFNGAQISSNTFETHASLILDVMRRFNGLTDWKLPIEEVLKRLQQPGTIDGIVGRIVLDEPHKLVKVSMYKSHKSDWKPCDEITHWAFAYSQVSTSITATLAFLGYVPADISNRFLNRGYPDKAEFDALKAYTVNSNPMNKFCRGQLMAGDKGVNDMSTRQRGEYENAAAERVADLDSFMEKSIFNMNSNTFVYRGFCMNGFMQRNATRGDGDCRQGRVPNVPAGTTEAVYENNISANAAFTSTTLSPLSSLLFACGNVNGTETHGICAIISSNSPVNAIWSHNVAGWNEQFEVLLARKYDLKFGTKLFDMPMKCGNRTVMVSVIPTMLVPHIPGAYIPMAFGSGDGGFFDKNPRYDEHGCTAVTKVVYANALKKAMRGIRKAGFSAAYLWEMDKNALREKSVTFGNNPDLERQAIAELKANSAAVNQELKANFNEIGTQMANKYGDNGRLLFMGLRDGMIVLNTPDKDTEDIATNVCFMLMNGADRKRYLNIYTLNGKRDIIRNDWHAPDDVHGSNYVNSHKSAGWSGELDNGTRQFNTARMFALAEGVNFELQESIPLLSARAEDIAKFVCEYIKYNKDVLAFPLQDVARYFDTLFLAHLRQEGYWLYSSIRPTRVGDPNNQQDGYVPLKYVIDGDDDSSLCIRMRMSRDKNTGELVFNYNGRSKDGSVNETRTTSFNTFDRKSASDFCRTILLDFARGVKLSCTRKAEAFLDFYAPRRHWILRTGKTYGVASESDSNYRAIYLIHGLPLNVNISKPSVEQAIMSFEYNTRSIGNVSVGRTETNSAIAKRVDSLFSQSAIDSSATLMEVG